MSPIHEIHAKSILRKAKRIDSWFCSSMSMNLYRGCLHDCAYCDGRAEQYRVPGCWGRDLEVKLNAPVILERELDPTRRRKAFPGGYLFLGGGVNDSYQAAETEYRLARKALELSYRFYHPVHILTKSSRVEEDLDLIDAIHRRRGALVSMSFSTVDAEIAGHFEPGASSPGERLKTLKLFKERGIPVGTYLLPVIPFISDTPEKIGESLAAFKQAGADFTVFGGMTLKEGGQKRHFLDLLAEYAPEKLDLYEMIYPHDPYGSPSGDYHRSINQSFNAAADYFGIDKRLPLRLFKDIVNQDERICLLLAQMGDLMELKGERSPFGFAAYSLWQRLDGSGECIGRMGSDLKRVKGVGPLILRAIHEIIETGTCGYYQRLLEGRVKPYPQ